MDILCRVKSTIEEYKLLHKGDRVLLSLSGGPDSLVLFHILQRLQEELDLTLEVFHLDHSLRPESVFEAEEVSELVKSWGFRCHCRKEDVAELHRQRGGSLQEVARQVRMEWLAKIARQRNMQRIAIGHHADDQVETFLLNLLRGSGMVGLGGIPYRGPGSFIRPLLGIWREEIEEYCRAQNLSPLYDPTNLEPKYRRNEIRLELIPFMEKYNPRLKEGIWRTAKLLQEEDLFLQKLSRNNMMQIVREKEKDFIDLDLAALKEMPRVIGRRVLMMVCKELAPNTSFYNHHLQRAFELVQKASTGKTLTLPGSLNMRKGFKVVRVSTSPHAGMVSYSYKLSVPGEILITESGVLLRAEVVHGEELPRTPNRVFIDGDMVGPYLEVRNRREGDRFHPLGAKGSKKLKDFFIDSKIEKQKRDIVPLVVAPEGKIIWVVGIRLSHEYRVKDSTTRMVALHLENLKEDNLNE